MDPAAVRAAWERATARAGARRADERGLAPSPLGDVPTFLEAPRATGPGELAGAHVAALGIPWDGPAQAAPGVTAPSDASPPAPGDGYHRGGAAEGPSAIRRASLHASLRHGGYLAGHDGDFSVLERLRLVDYGDVAAVPGDVEATFLRAHEKLADVIAAGALPIVLGGDHAVSVPVLQVLAGKLAGKLGIVSFDARLGLLLRPRYAAGSQWCRALELGMVEPANVVHVGTRGARGPLAERLMADELGTHCYTMADVDELGIGAVAQEALELAAAGTEAVYVSLDVSVLDPAWGGQLQPEPGGLTSRELLTALAIVSRGGLAGFEVCGVAPRHDRRGTLAHVAARAALEVVWGLAGQRP